MRTLEYALSAVAWLLALAIASTSLFAIFRFTHVLPFADQWDLTARLFSVNDLGTFLEALWAPHNVHRLVLFNVLNAIDYWLFSADNSFNRAAMACLAAASVAVFVLVLRAAGVARRNLVLWAAPAAIAAIFNGAQSELLTWPLGLQWHLVNLFFLCALLAVLSAAKADAGGRLAAFAMCVLASMAAGLSSGNGLLVWPVLALLAFAQRLPLVWIGGYAILGAAFIAIYLPGIYGGDLPENSSAVSLPDLIAYAARFSANLWYWADAPIQGEAFAIALGYAVLAGAVVLGVLLLCRRLAGRPHQVLAASIIFIVATGLLTAVGRVQYGIDQAFAPRYAGACGLLWAALLAWPMLLGRPSSPKMQAPMLALRTGILFWAAGALLAYQPQMLSTVAAWYGERERAALALIVGVRDEDLISAIYPHNPPRVFQLAEELRARRKSVFAEPRAGYPGNSLLSLAHPDDTACTGAAENLDAVVPNDGGQPASYRGHGWTNPALGAAGAILIANRQGQIIGLGSSIQDVRLPWSAPSPTPWIAVIAPGADAMGAFALTGTAPSPACALGAWTLNP